MRRIKSGMAEMMQEVIGLTTLAGNVCSVRLW